MKTDCDVIKDLLPLYIDDVISDDSRKLVEEHLKDCPDCRACLDRLSGGRDPEAIVNAFREAQVFENIRRKIRLKRIREAALAVLLTGLFFILVIGSGILTNVNWYVAEVRFTMGFLAFFAAVTLMMLFFLGLTKGLRHLTAGHQGMLYIQALLAGTAVPIVQWLRNRYAFLWQLNGLWSRSMTTIVIDGVRDGEDVLSLICRSPGSLWIETHVIRGTESRFILRADLPWLIHGLLILSVLGMIIALFLSRKKLAENLENPLLFLGTLLRCVLWASIPCWFALRALSRAQNDHRKKSRTEAGNPTAFLFTWMLLLILGLGVIFYLNYVHSLEYIICTDWPV